MVPLSLTAMEHRETQTVRYNFSDGIVVRATATFAALSSPQKKEFHRYLAPRYLECDTDGNVHEGDSLTVSIKTNRHAPMFHVITKLLAINEQLNVMKLACTVRNEHDPIQSSTVTMLLPLHTKCVETIPLIINDETNQPVTLSIETWPSAKDMPNNLSEEQASS